MLILTRKQGEALRIADGTIYVAISEIKGNRVKMAIHAPKNVDIVRAELELEPETIDAVAVKQ